MRKAVALILLAVLLAPARAGFLEEGLDLANEGKLEEALKKLEQAVKKSPQSAEALVALGLVNLRAKRYEKAEEALLSASKIVPNSAAVYYALGLLYEKLEEAKKAIAAWQGFLKLAPNQELRELARRHIQLLESR